MKIRYFKDQYGDLWRKIGKKMWVCYLNRAFIHNDPYRTWIYYRLGFKTIDLKYDLREITEEEMFVELL